MLLNEQQVKVALISNLYQKGMLKDATLINEMVIANWSRRADLALANGHLHAFEIKSDFDSLKRLDGQLDTYIARFEKVTVVCSPRFTREVLKRAHKHVEILETAIENGSINFKTIRRGKLHRLTDRNILFGFLLKTELQIMLRQNEVPFTQAESRKSLEGKASTLSVGKIRSAVLAALKRRYHDTSVAYISNIRRKQVGSIKDLAYLSKLKQGRKACDDNTQPHINKPIDGTERYAIDLNRLEQKYGALPDGMQGTVLRRVRTS